MKVENLISVAEYARQTNLQGSKRNTKGKTVTLAYYYHLIEKKRLDAIRIGGTLFVEKGAKIKKA